MSELIRAFDWSSTPIGPREQWPSTLRTTVDIMLTSQFPMALLWGRELILIYNDAYRLICANKHPAALGHSTREIWSEVWHINQPIIEAVMERGETLYFEDKLFPINRRGTQEDASFTLCYSPVRIEDGSIGGVLVILEETTERKRVEGELQNSASEWRTTFDAVEDAICLLDEDQNILRCNQVMSKLVQKSYKEIIGCSCWEIVHGTSAPIPGCPMTLMRKSLQRESTELFWNDKWLLVTVDPILGEEGKLNGALHIIHDVTEQKQAEKTLKQSEKYLQRAEELAHVGYWSRDIASGDITWSDEACRIFGLEPQVVGLNLTILTDHIHPDDRQMVLQANQDAVDGVCPYDLEYRIIRPNGSMGWVHSKGEFNYDEHGQPILMFGVVLDITERKRKEEALQQSHKQLRAFANRLTQIEEKERQALSRELHDRVGQTLTALSININLLGAKTAPENLASIDLLLNDTQALIEETSMHIRNLMADLRPPELDDYGLAAAIRGYCSRYAERIPIDIATPQGDISPQLPFETAITLFRIVQEALTNIAKHAQADQVKIALTQKANKQRMTIVDNGIGFNPNIFMDESNQKKWGVISMRERVEAIGGRFKIETKPGKGTKVIVEVPL